MFNPYTTRCFKYLQQMKLPQCKENHPEDLPNLWLGHICENI